MYDGWTDFDYCKLLTKQLIYYNVALFKKMIIIVKLFLTINKINNIDEYYY